MHVPYFDNPGGNLTAKVQLDNASNVFLVDQTNYTLYQSGQPFKYFGGYFQKNPVLITISGPGRWYLIVESSNYRYNWIK